jgi:hypothetical protein
MRVFPNEDERNRGKRPQDCSGYRPSQRRFSSADRHALRRNDAENCKKGCRTRTKHARYLSASAHRSQMNISYKINIIVYICKNIAIFGILALHANIEGLSSTPARRQRGSRDEWWIEQKMNNLSGVWKLNQGLSES